MRKIFRLYPASILWPLCEMQRLNWWNQFIKVLLIRELELGSHHC